MSLFPVSSIVAPSPLNEHYARVAPLLEAAFGAIPIVSASYPDGTSSHAHWNTKPLPLVPLVFKWCVDRLHAVEFHSWTPSPDHPDRLGYARILLEAVDAPNDKRVNEAARVVRDALNHLDLDAIPVLDGFGGIALFLPFNDAPEYAPVRNWLHQFSNQLAAQHGDLLSTEPNTRGENLVHIHVNHNAVRAWSVLPYSVRGPSGLPVCAPIAWHELDTIANGSITTASLPGRIAKHGDTFALERARIGRQQFSTLRSAALASAAQASLVIPSVAQRSRGTGTTISAAMQVLADGVSRSADQILESAVKLGLLESTYKAKYIYTALIEYIARANGNGRKPYIIQDEQRNFRINEPADDWPNLVPPAAQVPSSKAQALADRLTQAATGPDSNAFEVAVCDAFAHMGFASTHVGGQKAPDGYADAVLGPLGYRVMIECKTAKREVAQPDAFEAAKYRDAFRAQYCTLIGPAFPNEVELTKELQTHGVSAWTLDDLTTVLLSEANASELRTCFEPGYAADRITDLLWNRTHGANKRVRVIAELICQVGFTLQTAAARDGVLGDAPRLTLDTAMALVDQALTSQGSSRACTRDDVRSAFEHLTNPVVGRALWVDNSKAALVVLRLY